MAIAPVNNTTVNTVGATTAADGAAQVKNILDNAISQLTNMDTITHEDGSSWSLSEFFGPGVADQWKQPYLEQLNALKNDTTLTPADAQAKAGQAVQDFSATADFMRELNNFAFIMVVNSMRDMDSYWKEGISI